MTTAASETQSFAFSRDKSSIRDLLEQHGKKASEEVIEALEEEGFGDDDDDEEDEDAVDDEDQTEASPGKKTKMKERTKALWKRYTKDIKLPEDQAIPTKYRISFVHKEQYGASSDHPPAFDVVIVDEAHSLRNKRSYAHQFVSLTDRHAFCPVTASPTLNGIKDLRGLASLIRKTMKLGGGMRVPGSCTAEDYLRVTDLNPFEDAEYDYDACDGKQQTKKLPSLFEPDFRKTDEFAKLKAWYEEDPPRRQIHLLLDAFLGFLTQDGPLTNKVVQGLNNTIITRRQMTPVLTVPKELSGTAEDEHEWLESSIC